MLWNKWVWSAFFSNFFRDQAESDSEKVCEGGGMAEAGQKEEEKG